MGHPDLEQGNLIFLTYNSLCYTAGMTGMQKECSRETQALTKQAKWVVKLDDQVRSYHPHPPYEQCQAWISGKPVCIKICYWKCISILCLFVLDHFLIALLFTLKQIHCILVTCDSVHEWLAWNTHARTHARTHTRTHTRTHAKTIAETGYWY